MIMRSTASVRTLLKKFLVHICVRRSSVRSHVVDEYRQVPFAGRILLYLLGRQI